MNLPCIHFSRPAIVLPDEALDNDAVLRRVRESFRGAVSEWEPIEQGIRYVFDRCNTQVRYIEPDATLSPGEFASRAATSCLWQNGVEVSEIDLLVYGGIAREAFEPATASEVAGRLGAKPLHAIDVTCACAGLVEALHVVAGYFALHDELKTALVCAGELMRDQISYDIRSVEDVATRAAGLTIGNAAAAILVTREPLPGGSARLVDIRHKTLSQHYDLCTALDNLLIGTVEALTNEPIATDITVGLPVPTDFADAVTNAQTMVSEGEGELSEVAPFLSAGEYGSAVYVDLTGSELLSVFPLEELLLGAVAQF
jgi:3-oxoacyl-[acyl-carrier-protein] synthase-3